VSRFSSQRLAALVAGLWAGVLVGIGLVAAPAGFANAPPDIAGRVAGRMFAQEAYLSLLLTAAMLLLCRRTQTSGGAKSTSVLSADVLLVLGCLFCTVFGYFALQPMMAAARAGQGAISFGLLHAVSGGMFTLKGLLVLMLAWRLTAR
jgi:hypothetical protein